MSRTEAKLFGSVLRICRRRSIFSGCGKIVNPLGGFGFRSPLGCFGFHDFRGLFGLFYRVGALDALGFFSLSLIRSGLFVKVALVNLVI